MNTTSSAKDIEHLTTLIRGINVAMLTTSNEDGSLRSRPMATLEMESDGTLWFFTQVDSPKVDEVQKEQQVNVSYADSGHHRYVSVSGKAVLNLDHEKMKTLWNPLYLAWFPKGLEDPQIALLQVKADKAEYWDVKSSTMVQIVGFVKALATGKSYDPGENKKVDFQQPTINY